MGSGKVGKGGEGGGEGEVDNFNHLIDQYLVYSTGDLSKPSEATMVSQLSNAGVCYRLTGCIDLVNVHNSQLSN